MSCVLAPLISTAKGGQEMQFNAGYPGVEYLTHRVTIFTDGKPISALRLHFPGGIGLRCGLLCRDVGPARSPG